jgi:hypothetical protein
MLLVYFCLAHGWQHHIGGKYWHNRARTSGGEYSITDEGRVRPKHVLIEFKTRMCYIDGQKNKYSSNKYLNTKYKSAATEQMHYNLIKSLEMRLALCGMSRISFDPLSKQNCLTFTLNVFFFFT